VLIGLLLVLIVPFAWFLSRSNSSQPDAPEAPSLAVLPFVNYSGERDLDYLGDAVTEDLTTALAADAAIQVLAAHTALGAEDADTEPTILARRLGARYLIEGSIQGDITNLNFNVRLTDTSTNRHLWAKQYEQQVDNVLPVVDDITRHVATALFPQKSTDSTPPVVNTEPAPTSELGYDALIDSPKRLKCLYGNVAQIGGDHVTAALIFEDCIERWNDVRSMIALAHILELGVGVPQDLPRAASLLRRGAYTEDSEGFSSLARYHYGMALMLGMGVDPNSVEGFRWLRRAAAEGVEDARGYLAQHFPHQLPEYHVDGAADRP
jgi:TolB-like protein